MRRPASAVSLAMRTSRSVPTAFWSELITGLPIHSAVSRSPTPESCVSDSLVTDGTGG